MIEVHAVPASRGPARETEGGTGTRLPETTSVALDLIRTLSAQAVLIGHAASFFGVLPILRPPAIAPVQNIGVVAFFILSGYLITYTVFRKSAAGSYRFRTFAIERFARIFSGFVPGLIFILVIDVVVSSLTPATYEHGSALRPELLVSNFLMLQDENLGHWLVGVLPSARPVADLMVPLASGRPLWTLAIEWWIYLSFGWALLVLAARSRSVWAWAIFLALGLIPAYNLVGGRGNGLTLVWLLGAAVFWAGLRTPESPSTRVAAIGAGLTLALAMLRVIHTGNAYDAAFAILLATALHLLIVSLRSTPFLWNPSFARVTRFAAAFSMTLYVVHYSVLAAISSLGGGLPPWTAFGLGFTVANVVALALAVPFEMRHRALASWLVAALPGDSRGIAREPIGSAGPR